MEGIGYHFVIGKDGELYEGRPFEKKGAHVELKNTGKVGIALIGDYHRGSWVDGADIIPEEQLETLYKLTGILISTYNITEIGGHRDYKESTVCPGTELYDTVENLDIFYLSQTQSTYFKSRTVANY